MALIPEDKIAELRERSDIVQVVGEYVALRRSGVNFKGLCPFHAEKTPSFNVNSTKQIFHCFGCGKSGDVINFLMEMTGQSFIEVVRELARRSGVELPEREVSPAEHKARQRIEAERSRLFRVNALAAEFFRRELAGPRGVRARAYLEGRGINQTVEESFQLGFAPPGWDELVRFLAERKVPHELAERAGLVRARDFARTTPDAPPSRATHFDLFRDRIMCPVYDLHGEVVGFSGRLVDGGATSEAPKYLNTPETAVFKKGDQLFGLHAAKAAMRQQGRAIVVEGNFDVLMLHVHGLCEAVAPMGTALTPSQAHLLHRFSPTKVCLLLDGDAAGMRAAAKSVALFLDEDLLSFVALLPRGEDPDSFLRRHGRAALEQLLESARESVEYFCDHAWAQGGSSIPERVKILEEEAAPLLRKVKNDVARRRYAQRLAYGLDLPLEMLERLIRTPRASDASHAMEKAMTDRTAAADTGQQSPAPTMLAPTDAELVALLADHPRLLMRLGPLGVLEHIVDPELRAAFEALGCRTDSVAVDARALAEAVAPALRAQVMRAAMSGRYAEIPDPERALRSILHKREIDELLKALEATLAAARAAGDTAQVQQLNARFQELKQQRLGLKN